MKKKVLSVLLVLMLLLSVAALGEGKLKITQKNLIIYSGDDSGYFYAKVENVGDAPIGVGYGDLVLFSEDDEIILTENYVSPSPSGAILQPGEYLYIKEYLWDDALLTTPVADYKFSLPSSDRADEMGKVPCEGTFELSGDKYGNYIYVTFTNTTGMPRYDFYVNVALFDAEGNLIFVDSDKLSSLAIHPEGTVTLKLYIDSSMMEHYLLNNIVPNSVDAIVCYLNE